MMRPGVVPLAGNAGIGCGIQEFRLSKVGLRFPMEATRICVTCG